LRSIAALNVSSGKLLQAGQVLAGAAYAVLLLLLLLLLLSSARR